MSIPKSADVASGGSTPAGSIAVTSLEQSGCDVVAIASTGKLEI